MNHPSFLHSMGPPRHATPRGRTFSKRASSWRGEEREQGREEGREDGRRWFISENVKCAPPLRQMDFSPRESRECDALSSADQLLSFGRLLYWVHYKGCSRVVGDTPIDAVRHPSLVAEPMSRKNLGLDPRSSIFFFFFLLLLLLLTCRKGLSRGLAARHRRGLVLKMNVF